MNPCLQPVEELISWQGEVGNSPKAHCVFDIEVQPDFEQFLYPETRQGEGFVMAHSYSDGWH